jgi:AcrR family transcriptional regulator
MPKPPASPEPAGTAPAARPPRVPLSRDRVLRAALQLADAHGIDAVSMRRLGQALSVEAMSLYKHVTDKEDILDGLADLVMAEVEVPEPGVDWKAEVRRGAISLHAALRRHPWAGPVLESRIQPGPARLRYLDAVVGTLRAAGFELPLIAKAFMALDSHTYGFTMQELAWPFDSKEAPEVAASMAAGLFAGGYPNLAAMAGVAAAGEVDPDFAFGLDLILEGLARHLAATR